MLFGSGTDYEIFLDSYCNRCRNLGSRSNACPIKKRMEEARFISGKFPEKYLVIVKRTLRYTCPYFNGENYVIDMRFDKFCKKSGIKRVYELPSEREMVISEFGHWENRTI